MILKKYQIQTLSILRRYLEFCRLFGPESAYNEIVNEEGQKHRLGRYAQGYRKLEGLPDIPYVCFRLPTGGGKTLLAARSISVARDAWVEKDYPTVLWLVPSNTIQKQTVEALKNPRHPYRQSMDEDFESRVRVFDIADFVDIRPQDIRDNLTVVVGTIQTLRVQNTEGRKVYAHNENMEPHFSGVPDNQPGLEKINDSERIKFSFANLLHMVHPILIVDEAHNAMTGLSREMQKRISPSAIIEFTATPRLRSNILHSVTAQELKDEEMVKLPIVLAEHPNWQSAVDGAVQRRQDLANLAKNDKRYIRPIVLFQAQKKNGEVTVDVLKDYLVNTSRIDEEKLTVATGDQRGLDGINLFDPACPVEFVITIEALKEGWDCSFAYVFCSVARIGSGRAVEQLLGRVLRMPFAQKRDQPELNRAYAHVSEPTFAKAANDLRDKLVAMGFDEQEAALNIELELEESDQLALEGGLFGQQEKPKPKLTEILNRAPDFSGLSDAEQETITVEDAGSGLVKVSVIGNASDKVYDAIASVLTAKKKKSFSERAKEHKRRVDNEMSPAARDVPFRLPRLLAEVDGQLEFADHEVFNENHDWSLLDYPTGMEAGEFDIREEANVWEIDLDGRHLAISFATLDEQLSLDVDVEGWTENNLVLSLDKLIADPFFSQSERMRFCLDHVSYLVHERKISISALWRAKFVLARKLDAKIKDCKEIEANKAYQRYLFEAEARPSISFDQTFEFQVGMYDGQVPYRGRYGFPKHFLEVVPAIDGKPDGEEVRCAVSIDGLPEVKHWLRNISSHPASFRLPMAKGWTYPDFVAELHDGRLLVVEYKGALLLNEPETGEKKLIGELWEQEMGGRGLYLMAVKDDHGKDVRAQLVEKLGGVG